uniref:Uncharacterized protein n=2 Tax=Kalanchoe fedtschenkoi TaxID=63787 RepID=A0A7N0VGP3_KALFE
MKKNKGGKGIFRYADHVDKLFLLFGVIGSIGEGLMSPLTMIVLSDTINDFGSGNSSISNQVIDEHAFKLLWVAVGVGIAAFIEGFCWTRTAERQTSRMRMEYLRSVLRQDATFFDSQGPNSTTFQVMSNLSTDAHLIQDVVSEKIPNCLSHVSSFFGSLIVAFILSWHLALAALPLSILFITPGVGFGKVLMGLGKNMKDASEKAGGIAEQATSAIRTVYSYVGEKHTLDKFSHALEKTKELGIKQGLVKGLLMGSMGVIFAAWAFQAWVGMILVTERGEKGGTVFVAGICIILGGLSIMSALPNISFISEAAAASARIMEMIDLVPEIDSAEEKGEIPASVRGDIEFRDVHFHYPSRPDAPILRKFNLKVEAGETIGLVGSSGSGKSTIISLLQRFYNPAKGEILLDRHKIKKIRLSWLRSQMGLVNQEPILFATSIRENILFGEEGASSEQIVNAAKAANAHDFISKLPDGYDTQVGQFGVQLSGGQKQRIAIARALIRSPKILLLDEATSALDAESEQIVQEALDNASRETTTIVVAHRLTTIRNADKIAVIQSGKVVELGSHEELISLNHGVGGVYLNMVKLQQSARENQVPGSTHHSTEKKNYKQMTSSPTSPPSVYVSQCSSPYPYSVPTSISLAPSYQTRNCSDFYDSEDCSQLSNPSPSQWRLLLMNVPEWKRGVLGCLAAAVTGIVQPVHAYLLGTVVAVYFQTHSSKMKSEIGVYCYIFLSLAVISFLSNLLQHYNFAVMGECLAKRVREKMLENVLTFEIGWFDRDENTSAAIGTRIATEAGAVRALIGDRILLLLQVFATASLAFLLALVVAWRIAIVMIAIQPFLITSFYAKSMMMKSMSVRAKKAQNEGTQLASEAVINHRTITAFSSQNRILGLFQGTMEGPKRESIRQSWSSGIALFSSQFLTTASIALAFWYGGRLLNEKKTEAKNLFQVFFILMSTGKHIADAGSMSSDIAKGTGAVKSVFKILDRKSEIIPDDPKGIKAKGNIKGIIELKKVVFCYPSRQDRMIFTGLDLKIEAGKTMALIGQSGSGKSTVIGLIERFYDPIHGSVNMDGRNVMSYNLRHLRSQIALVSQEPTLFAGTIRENIMYGKEEATETDLLEAAIQANAHAFISSMKDGYATYCGERGVQLSGGQKQRIAIARAILKSPAILLLDEATSALDSASETLVQQALDNMMVGRTCVVVAHRLSTIQKSDCIAVIKNGKVVEKGSHSELLSLGRAGSYYSLINLQGGQSSYK